MTQPVRTRFSIDPAASLQIEAARVALLNWLVARGGGGRFLLRIDRADAPSDAADTVARTLDDLRWLGLDWDEGPDDLSAHDPHLLSSRYEPYYRTLIDRGRAYWTFDTPQELEQMRRRALARWRPFRYPRPSRLPADEDVQRARREGRPIVLRLRMPGRDVTVDDCIVGPVTLPAEELDDPVIRREDGRPTWLFTETIDDALAQISHVIRGQARLPYAHRQAVLREALGLDVPVYAHLPLILGADGAPLSGEIDIPALRSEGYLPEAVVALLAGLGRTAPSAGRQGAAKEDPAEAGTTNASGPAVPPRSQDQGLMTRERLIREFDLRQVSRSAPRFDWKRLASLNAAALAEAGQDRLVAGLRDCLWRNDTPLQAADEATLAKLLRLAAPFETFRQVEQKCRVLFVSDEQVVYDDRAVRKVLARGDPRGFEVLEVLRTDLAGQESWQAESLGQAIDRIGRRTGLEATRLAQVIRVAVTGRIGAMSIGLMLEVLGRQRALRRIERCLARCEP